MGGMSPEQALEIFSQIIAQTRATPSEHNTFRVALETLARVVQINKVVGGAHKSDDETPERLLTETET